MLDPLELDQTLLLAPDLPFSQLEPALLGLGYTRLPHAAATPPMIPGEPELALFQAPGRLGATLAYSFNPVVGLRVLEVGALGPDQRADLAERLRLLDPLTLPALLAEKGAKRRLLGILAATATDALDMAAAIAPLAEDPEPAVADAATAALEHFVHVAQARAGAAERSAQLSVLLQPLLIGLRDGAVPVQALRPRPTDYPALFDDAVADQLAVAYDPRWEELATPQPGRGYPAVDALVAPAGLLRWPNALSRAFPPAWRAAAPYLRPEGVWATWRCHGPGTRGVLYDGLANVGERWVWLPRVVRVLRQVVGS